ncbi:unnamed protein product [Allacma fusca]|uniref:Uncharacterized protein n=1 Tax=Allacma fusca TaxID=39272 RepID=A0A8J2J6D3_9HEXA|nr:unnamed protein product [Allacma fusca]
MPTYPKDVPDRLDQDHETDPLLALITARRLLRNSRLDSDSSEFSFSSAASNCLTENSRRLIEYSRNKGKQ